MENDNIFFDDKAAAEAIKDIEKIKSYRVLCKIQETYIQGYTHLCKGELYYTAMKNSETTKLSVTLENGMHIADILCNGDWDTLPPEYEKKFIEAVKKSMEEIIAVLNKKIAAAEIAEKKYEKTSTVFMAILSVIALFLLAMVFFSSRA